MVGGAVDIVEESLITKCAITEAGGGIGESLKTNSRRNTELLETHRPTGKTVKRLITHSNLGTGNGIALKRPLTDSHIGAEIESLDVSQGTASCIVEKCPGAHGCIAAGSIE